MKNAMERLNKIVKERGPLVAGLDPDIKEIQKLYETFGVSSKSYEDMNDKYQRDIIRDFSLQYIRAIKKVVGAIKINIAFFEENQMVDIFFYVAKMAKANDLFVIGDIKRADIGSTSAKYAEAFLNSESPFDAITINPYFGFDSVKPFLDMAKLNDKGIFVLVKTSNSSSADIQDLVLENGDKVYEKVAELVGKWGEYTRPEGSEYNLVGAVVGATHPQEAIKLRKQLPNTFFLVPGYGAQGASAGDVAVNFDNFGGGAIVNSSRGIMNAWKSKLWSESIKSEEWAKDSSAEAERAKKEISKEVQKHIKFLE